MQIHALPIDVYQFPFGDCSNNGISNRFTRLLVACEDGPWVFDAEKETPLNLCRVILMYGTVCVVPAMVNSAGHVVARPGWWMYGGNIADTSDCRWKYITGVSYPLKIYDRKE